MERLRPLVIAITSVVLAAYVIIFGIETWEFWWSAKPNVQAAVIESTTPQSAKDFIWTSVSVLVGSVVAVALGQPDPTKAPGFKVAGPTANDLIVAYAWAWFFVGVVAAGSWVWGDQSGRNTPLLIRNAATTFGGLVIPVVAAYLKDRDQALKHKALAE